MFGKQIVEVCVIVAYWVLFVPLLLVWFKLDINDKPFDYFFEHSDQALYLILGYLVLYRIIRYVFIDFKSIDLRLWHNLRKTKAEVDLQLKEAKSYKDLDTVDGPPATLSYCSPSIHKQPPTPASASPAHVSGNKEVKWDQSLNYSDGHPVHLNHTFLKPLGICGRQKMPIEETLYANFNK